MASGAVLSQKVRIPLSAGLQRDRLLMRLIGPEAAQVTVLIAPAGCGKTTLLAQAAAAAAGPTGWYCVEPGDGSEATLVRHVTSVLPEVFPARAGPPITSVDELLHRLDEWSGAQALLVIDDVHEVAGTSAERALARLVSLSPPGVHILLGSRRRPSLNLSRLEVTRLVRQLDREDLRFRCWEVERLFRDVYQEPLPPESVALLTRRTEGWAAGLQLFHLATAGKTTAERRAAVSSLSGRARLIRSYLAENVLAELRPPLRRFLTRTSALGLLSGALCDALLETSGSQTMLLELQAAELFTTSPDDGLTFRYHQVFQDHLEAALQDELGDRAREWYRRSARLLEGTGHPEEALRAHARAEDWGAVARLHDRAGAGLLDGRAPAWDDLVPAALRTEDPWLALVDARRKLRRGAVAAAVDGFRHAEASLPDVSWQAQCRQERRLASLWLSRPPTAGMPEPARGSVGRHWSEQLRAATRTLAPDALSARPEELGDRLAAGLIQLLRGDVHGATSELRVVADGAPGNSTERVVALVACAVTELLTGERGAARLEQAALEAELADQPWLERLIRAVLDAVLPSPVGEDGGASTSAARHARSEGDDWGAALLLLLQGAYDVLGGGVDHADALAQAAVQFSDMRAPVLAVWARALGALALDHRGAPDARVVARSTATAARKLRVRGAEDLAGTVLDSADDSTAQHAFPPGTLELLHSPRSPLPVPSAPAPPVRLQLLGRFRFEVAGRPVSWTGVRPRALTLLRVLSLSPDVDVHRESLIDALWPEVSVEVGTHRLQVAVSSLRRALEDAGLPRSDVLARRGEAYRLSLPPGASVDVRELEVALAEASAARSRAELVAAGAAARRALLLYRGELLPGDGPAEWVVRARERLRLHVAEAARELAESCLSLADVRGGIEAARRSLELDPFQERAWVVLAQLHERSGDRAAAEHARHRQASAVAALVGPAQSERATAGFSSHPPVLGVAR